MSHQHQPRVRKTWWLSGLHRLTRLTGLLLLCSGIVWVLLPRPPLLEDMSFSREVFDRNGHRLAVTLSADDKYRIFTPLAEISPALIEATLRQEDRYFALHAGVNPVALLRSVLRYAGTGKSRYGASTITMQLARLRYGLRTRTVSGKLNQILYALKLERHYSKDAILEAYLNLAPYGGNLEGVGAASLAIFRKSPSSLTTYEAIALSVIPQSPARRGSRRGGINPALQEAMARVGGSGAGEFQVFLRGNPEIIAPHFVRLSLRENEEWQVRTTLDSELQKLVEDRVSSWVASQRQSGLENASVLLLDWKTQEVLAHVGSADFYSETIHGQVDGTRARRSPGSTLKPFVYALAMQQGLVHPDSILLDAPRSFSGYNPENNDREFAGPLKTSQALARSRNVPAVELTRRLGASALHEFLQECGVNLPKPASHYGLSLTLGGGEVRLHDLARLYAMLANQGRMEHRQTLTPEAAFLTLEMLGTVPSPPGHAVKFPVHWKTGTSHGFHDAWSVGVAGPYVLAVWAGDFKGRGNPALTGRTAAAPLFFQILESLDGRGKMPRVAQLPPAGSNLRKVALCHESGHIPGAFCPHQQTGWFIPGVSTIAGCAVHQEVLIDTESGLRVVDTEESRQVRREVFEFWPADIQRLFAQAGVPRRQAPPLAPGQLMRSGHREALTILSPRGGAVYTRQERDVTPREVTLRIVSDANPRKLFWFSGDKFLGTCNSDEYLQWVPPAGAHTVTVIDQDGRQAVAEITVEVLGNG